MTFFPGFKIFNYQLNFLKRYEATPVISSWMSKEICHLIYVVKLIGMILFMYLNTLIQKQKQTPFNRICSEFIKYLSTLEEVFFSVNDIVVYVEESIVLHLMQLWRQAWAIL